MPEPICADSSAAPCFENTSTVKKLEIESDRSDNVYATFIVKPIIKCVHSAQAAASSHSHLAPSLNRIPFCLTTAGVWLTANIIKLCGLSLSVEWNWKHILRWQSPITFCVRVFTALELFHFIIPLKLPPSKTNRQQRPQQQQQQHSRPCHPCIAGGGEGSFQAAVNSSFCLGKGLMPIQTTGAVSFFNHHTEKQGRPTSSSPSAMFVTITQKDNSPLVSLRGKTLRLKNLSFMTPAGNVQLAESHVVILQHSQWIWETRMRDYLMLHPFKRPIQPNQSILINEEMTDEIPSAAAKVSCIRT